MLILESLAHLVCLNKSLIQDPRVVFLDPLNGGVEAKPLKWLTNCDLRQGPIFDEVHWPNEPDTVEPRGGYAL